MCPGLTSKGGALEDEAEAEEPVVSRRLVPPSSSICRAWVFVWKVRSV